MKIPKSFYIKSMRYSIEILGEILKICNKFPLFKFQKNDIIRNLLCHSETAKLITNSCGVRKEKERKRLDEFRKPIPE